MINEKKSINNAEPAAVSITGSLQTIQPPESPLQQIGAFQTALYTGSAQYSYPLAVPPGTAGLVPSLSLTYNSGSACGRSDYLGQGWDMGTSYVLREDKNGTPDYASDDAFTLFLNGRSHDLIRLHPDGRFYTEIESDLLIQYVPDGTGNNYKGYFLVRSPDGITYRFGYNFDSEHVCSTRDYVTAWYLDEVADTNGNHIYYAYAENPYPNDIGAIYPARIEYNNDKSRVVEYVYETADRPDKPSVYTEGCRTRMTRRLAEVRISAGGTLIRRYGLSYANRTLATGSLLAAITEYGRDGTALPPTKFTYAAEDSGWYDSYGIWAPPGTPGLEDANVEMQDVNRDGLVDIVDGDETWQVYLNTGQSWPATGANWLVQSNHELSEMDTELADVNNDGLPDIVEGEGTSWWINFNDGRGWASRVQWPAGSNHNLEELDTQLVDVNGDGLPDIVEGEGTSWTVNINTGSGWTGPSAWPAGSDHNLEEADTQLVDVNGDGLPDIVEGDTTWTVNINNGAGWESPQVWLTQQNHRLDEDDTALGDVNGDGYADIIEGDGESGWEVNLNNGAGWDGVTSWLEGGPNFDREIRLTDTGGDGFPDIVSRQGGVGWMVHRNRGNRGYLLTGIRTSYGGSIAIEYGPSTGLDHTGPDDVSDLGFNVWVVTKVTQDNGLSGPQRAVVTQTFAYRDGLHDYADEEFRGFNRVTATDATGTSALHLTHQDDARKGLVERSETRGPGGQLYAETINTYSQTPQGSGYIVRLARTEQKTFDGVAAGPKVAATEYTYDVYGNVTHTASLGDVGLAGDERHEYAEFAYNPGLWLVNRPKHVWRTDGATTIRESWLYYDGQTQADAVPARGNLTRQVDRLDGGDDRVTTFQYDSYGNQTAATDPNGNKTTLSYDPTHTFVVATTNAKNQTTLTAYDPGTGNLLSKTDPNGYLTANEYDAFGRPLKEIQPYDSAALPTISYTYALDGTAPEGVIVRQRAASGATATLDTYTFIDGFGRVIQTRSPAEEAGQQIVQDVFYDDRGRVSQRSVPHFAPQSTGYTPPAAGVRATIIAYDPMGRETKVTNPDGTAQTMEYDHWRVDRVDENGHKTSLTQDAYGNTIRVEEYNGAQVHATSYAYSVAGELLKITDAAGNVFTWTFDTLGRQTRMDDPDMGAWTYEYDPAGNMIAQTDARGITVKTTYDPLNRPLAIDYPSQKDTVYLYDTKTVGTLGTVIDASGSVAYEYDQRLRPVREVRTMEGLVWETITSYDAADRVTAITYPDGQTVTFTFNPQGQIETAGGLVTDFDYNAQQKITRRALGNGVATSFTYSDEDFRLERIETPGLQDLSYAYDAAGNVKSITDSRRATTETFQYDALDRLTDAQELGGYHHTYAYSTIGNILSAGTDEASWTYLYGEGAGPHAVTKTQEEWVNSLASEPLQTTGNPLAGESMAVSLEVRNVSGGALAIKSLGVEVRGPGCMAWDCPNRTAFPEEVNLTLPLAGTHTFAANRAFAAPGDYLMQAYWVDSGEKWHPLGAIVSFKVSPGLEIVQPLQLIPSSPGVSQTVTATFTVRNSGNRPVTLTALGVVARGPGCADWACPGNLDFPFESNISIEPDETYSYSKARLFAQTGQHFAEAAFSDTNPWWYPVHGGQRVPFAVGQVGLENRVFLPAVSR